MLIVYLYVVLILLGVVTKSVHFAYAYILNKQITKRIACYKRSVPFYLALITILLNSLGLYIVNMRHCSDAIICQSLWTPIRIYLCNSIVVLPYTVLHSCIEPVHGQTLRSLAQFEIKCYCLSASCNLTVTNTSTQSNI